MLKIQIIMELTTIFLKKLMAKVSRMLSREDLKKLLEKKTANAEFHVV